MFLWPWRYSGADGLLCTGQGGPCPDEWCMCQPCPLCEMNGDEKREDCAPPKADCAPPKADCDAPKADCDAPKADCDPPDCDPPDGDPATP